MSAIAAASASASLDSASCAPGFNLLPHRARAARSRRRRSLIECVAAVLAGALAAAVWAAFGSAGEGSVAGQRAMLEAQLAELSAPLAEYARLERASESGRVRALQAQARARPYVHLLALLESLSREADAGVIVSRLKQTDAGFELQVRASDSAACAAWVERLGRGPGVRTAEMGDIKLVSAPIAGEAGRAIEAAVRLHWSEASPSSPLRRTALASHGRSGGGER